MPLTISTSCPTGRFSKSTRGTTLSPTTPGSASALPIQCTQAAIGPSGCPLTEYDTVNDRLLFAEGNTVRFVTKPYDTTNSTYGTLFDAGRVVAGSSYRPTLSNVYYMSSDGKLYCYDLSAANPATCNNTTVGSSSPLPSLFRFGLVRDDNDDLYLVDAERRQILKYDVP